MRLFIVVQQMTELIFADTQRCAVPLQQLNFFYIIKYRKMTASYRGLL